LIKFAIVGCGRIAQKHAALNKQHGKLVAVCDIIPDKAKQLGDEYRAKYYCSLDEMLTIEKGLNVLVVCTPNGLHPMHTISGLESGLHVICEKPMAIRLSDADEMITAAAKADRELFVIKQNRFNQAVVVVKDLLEQNKLGKIFSVQLNAFWSRGADYYENSWHGKKNLDGGILFTQFSHFIDLLYWFFGDMEKISAYKKNFHTEYEKEIEDTLVVGFEMGNSILGTAHFTVNSYKTNMEGSLTIFGEKGTVKIGGRYLNNISYSQMESGELLNIHDEYNENDYGNYTGSMSNHPKVYEHIVNVLAKKECNRFTGFNGMKTVEMINKIYEAAE
jgi:UDP-N-acetyl-2-amino-2-deoxyglucuronate dehydrogenase